MPVPHSGDSSPAPVASGPHSHSSGGARRTGSAILLGTGLILIGLNLRPAVASVGPVLTDIQDDLGFSATAASLLTTIPVFAFGAFAFLTPLLSRRLGTHRLLGILMLVLTAGILLRLHPSLTALFAGTVLLGAAIAVGNVLLPPAIKQDFPHRAGLMMGLYSMVLFVGPAIASGATAPLAHAPGSDWRRALAVWALPAILAFALWLPQLRRGPRPRPTSGAAGPPVPSGFRTLVTDPTALAVTAHMGLQSAGYYTFLTWTPALLQDAGVSAAEAGLMIAYSALPAILASLAAPVVAARMRRGWVLVVLTVAVTGTGLLGLLLAPAAGGYAWMTLLGLGQGAAIGLALSYIVARSADAQQAAGLSTMAQGSGYVIAGLGPLGFGAVHSLTGGWAAPLAVLLLALVLQLVAGILASQDIVVGERRKRAAS